MSCESHWEENVRLADENKWRPPKNYRPVSLTSLTSKVMEHIVYCQISRHLSINRISSPHQHGFQRGLSCETQLITVIYEWALVLDVHGQVDVVFLDFAKAFDSVPHERLLLKADYFVIRNKTNIWLRSFLTGRLRGRLWFRGCLREPYWVPFSFWCLLTIYLRTPHLVLSSSPMTVFFAARLIP